MSGWNYRLTVRTIDGEDEWAIREIYYGEVGQVVNWTKNPVAPTGETRQEFDATLLRMCAAIERPVYDLDAGCWCDIHRRPVPTS